MIIGDNREAGRLDLLNKLDAAKTPVERNRLGQFATPLKLASAIVAHAVSLLPPRSRICFLEPGFGTGPFYSALLNCVSPRRVQAARGFEIDPHYGEPSKQFWIDAGLCLTIGDFTRAEPPIEGNQFNLVVCNPPYVRHHHLNQIQKKELHAAVARHIGFEMNGLSGLYTYFLVLSKSWMTAGGVGAWLVPSEFMDVNYGRKVKEFLLRHVTLHQIHRYDPLEIQFQDALVSSAVVFFTNASPPKNHRVKFSFGGTLDSPRISTEVSIDRLENIAKWTSLPQNVPPRRSRKPVGTLADFFRIKRGLATGCNRFFILTPSQIDEYCIPKEFLVPIIPSPKDLESDEVAADRHGAPQIKNQRFLLSCGRPEDEVRRNHPSLWKYLERGRANGVADRYLCRHRSPWYCQELRPASPLLCTYMERPTKRSRVPFRFILNRSNATAANVYLMLYPKPALLAVLKNDTRLLTEVWQALSSITAEMLTGEGRIYGGGLHKMEPNELAKVSADVLRNVLPHLHRSPKQRSLFA